jgi:hypothetical protein
MGWSYKLHITGGFYMTEVDRQLYENMQSYISSVKELQELCQKNEDKKLIQEKYKILKNVIKEEAKMCEKLPSTLSEQKV